MAMPHRMERRPVDPGDHVDTRVSLTPIAAPSILGLFGFAGATLVVAGHTAGWYGNDQSPLFLFPFAAFFGGLAQFSAGGVGVPRPRRDRHRDARHVGSVLDGVRRAVAADHARRAQGTDRVPSCERGDSNPHDLSVTGS